MHNTLPLVLVAAVLLSVNVAAQKPCSKADLKASVAEARLVAERVKSESLGARVDEMVRELDKQKLWAGTAEQQHVVFSESAKRSIAELEKSLVERDNRIRGDAELFALDRMMISFLTGEKAKALLKIQVANKRWNCKVLHLGCIK